MSCTFFLQTEYFGDDDDMDRTGVPSSVLLSYMKAGKGHIYIPVTAILLLLVLVSLICRLLAIRVSKLFFDGNFAGMLVCSILDILTRNSLPIDHDNCRS